MWEPSGQPACGITHMGPKRNPVALPIWVDHMGVSKGAKMRNRYMWNPYVHVCWVVTGHSGS